MNKKYNIYLKKGDQLYKLFTTDEFADKVGKDTNAIYQALHRDSFDNQFPGWKFFKKNKIYFIYKTK